MPVIWYAEPNYEDVLTGRGPRGGAAVRRRVLEVQWLLGLLAGPADLVVCEEPPVTAELCELLQGLQYRTPREACRELQALSDDERSDWEFSPWAWSDAAIRFGHEAGLILPDIASDQVRRMNSRRCWPGAEALPCSGIGPQLKLPVTVCSSTQEVEWAIAELERLEVSRWLLKAEFGHSGRNQMRGAGAVLKSQDRAWLEKFWAVSCCVVVEPVLQRIAECGLQWKLTQHDSGIEPQFLGAIGLLTDNTGRYCGSLLGDWCEGSDWWQHAVGFQREVVCELGRQGLRGFLGGDCMLTSWQGIRVVRPLQDLNARTTMGQIARGLQKFLQPQESAVWWHFSRNGDRERVRLIAKQQIGVTVRETGPCSEHLDGGSCLLTVSDTSQLTQIVESLRGGEGGSANAHTG